MILDDVHRGILKHKPKKRVGRGPGSGHGKTSGRGHKGYGSRAGSSRRTGFEGGQTPLFMRAAKRGFSNAKFRLTVLAINVSALEEAFDAGTEVTPELLVRRGMTNGRFDAIKILGDGELSKSLTVRAHKFSGTAKQKIEAAGGSAVELDAAKRARKARKIGATPADLEGADATVPAVTESVAVAATPSPAETAATPGTDTPPEPGTVD